jgi:N-acyl-D-aspartate/D-glutamate deacylase
MFKSILLMLIFATVSFAQSVIIKNAMIIDGSGKSAYKGDVQIKGDKIIH